MINQDQKVRTWLVVGGGCAVWLFLLIGLVRIQILEHEFYRSRAERQHTTSVDVPCSRGGIFDRNGELLVGSLRSPSIIANPKQIKQPSAVSRKLAPILNIPEASLRASLSGNRDFVWLKRRVDPAIWSMISDADLPGIYCLLEMDRVRPHGALAAQVVGMTDVDNVGIEGIEKEFESDLCGVPGWQVLQRVPSQASRPSSNLPTMSPVDGNDVVLTLDVRMQSAAEVELRETVLESNSAWGMALVMDPRTGEILAMTSFSREQGDGFSAGMNRCVAAQFEPGSTFKLITFAAAIEMGIIKPEDLYYAWNGRKDFGGYTIRDHHEYDTLTVREAFEFSSNIVTAQIAEALGARNLYSYSRAFGVAGLTGINLPGEVRGKLRRPSEWSGRSLTTLSIGHEVAVNLVQLVFAFGAIANDGILMEPRIVKEVRSRNGDVVRDYPPRRVRRVVSVETAEMMREFMAGVVERGTGKAAALPGWRAGGKSGTAQLVLEDGSYAQSRFTASFIGFAPVRNPKVVVAVVLVDPSGARHSGGQLAGPVFRNILTRAACSDLSDSFGFDLQKRAVASWLELVDATDEAPFEAVCAEAVPRPARMPDVSGMPVREAKQILLQYGAAVRCEGAGRVKSQTPPAGSPFSAADISLLTGSDG